MNVPKIENILSTLTILIDTREQDTDRLKKRVEGFKCPSKRYKLNYGDYSASYILNNSECYLDKIAVVERKMNLDELCNCFTKDRKRFAKEFERAKIDGAKVYLLIENNCIEDLLNGKYRSNLSPKSLLASLFSWSIKYNMQFMFAKSESTGTIIKNLMHYELRNYLMNCGDEAE